MARLMSVSLTEPSVVDRTKTVTRRLGWRTLAPGDRLTLCRKVMGRRPGEPLVRIAEVEVTAVSREPLADITPAEVAAEGFPDWTPGEFVAFFCGTHRGCTPATEVTRIEWRYLDSPPPVAAGQLALGINDRAAWISSCGTYRYSLGRRWAPGPCLRWVMLNPSTADAAVDDPTIRRVVGFSADAGYGACVVVNLYALRARDPAELAHHRAPVGPDNDTTLAAVAHATALDTSHHSNGPAIVVAWGARAPAGRVAEVLAGPLAGRRLLCLGTTTTGQPRHPLYVPAAQPLEPWGPS